MLLVSFYALKAADAETLGGQAASAFVLAETLARLDATPPPRPLPVPIESERRGCPTRDCDLRYRHHGNMSDKVARRGRRHGRRLGGVRIGRQRWNRNDESGRHAERHEERRAQPDHAQFVRGRFLRQGLSGAHGTRDRRVATASAEWEPSFNLYGQGHDGVITALQALSRWRLTATVAAGKVPGAIVFQTSDSNGSFAERMRTESAGNVGIGTASPIGTLHVTKSGAPNLTHAQFVLGRILFDKGFLARTARGTAAAPPPCNTGNLLFNLAWSGSRRSGLRHCGRCRDGGVVTERCPQERCRVR